MKVQKYSTTVGPFAGISLVNHSFNKSGLAQLIDTELGSRVKTVGYSYSDIIRNLTNVFLSGGDVVEDINNPSACRAVGQANSQNPIPIIIPCHRVIGKSGKLTGYAGGLDRKQSLLKMEGVSIEDYTRQYKLF